MEEESDTRNILQRAMEWDGSFLELVEIGWEISDAFDSMANEDDEYKVREACDELLLRDDLPNLYRAQFLLFMASTDDEADLDSVRYRLGEASLAITEAQLAVRQSIGEDERVEKLARCIRRMIADVNKQIQAKEVSAMISQTGASKNGTSVKQEENGESTTAEPAAVITDDHVL